MQFCEREKLAKGRYPSIRPDGLLDKSTFKTLKYRNIYSFATFNSYWLNIINVQYCYSPKLCFWKKNIQNEKN